MAKKKKEKSALQRIAEAWANRQKEEKAPSKKYTAKDFKNPFSQLGGERREVGVARMRPKSIPQGAVSIPDISPRVDRNVGAPYSSAFGHPEYSFDWTRKHIPGHKPRRRQ